MPRRRYHHTPPAHCAHCGLPDPDVRATPSPPELAGQTCSLTAGLNGPVCGRPATALDDRGKPICDVFRFKDVIRHIGEMHPELRLGVLGAQDPSLAPAAQDPPEREPAWIAEVPDPDRPFTVGDARAFVQDAVSLVVNSVETVVEKHCGAGAAAAMAQDPTVAVHAAGLCGDGACAPCRSQRRAEHLQGKQFLADELDRSIEWTGRRKVGEQLASDGSDALADVLMGWRDAGRPEPAKRIRVVQ